MVVSLTRFARRTPPYDLSSAARVISRCCGGQDSAAGRVAQPLGHGQDVHEVHARVEVEGAGLLEGAHEGDLGAGLFLDEDGDVRVLSVLHLEVGKRSQLP